MTVQWCDPPANTRSWRHLLSPFLERPGEWGMVREYDQKKAAVDVVRHLRRSMRGKGSIRIPDGRWEFRQGQIEPDMPRYGVWAKWEGP